ncbi:hypothetical protein tinsulaeT_27950 [Thalassotalea insulae]|uniref:Uncharacterized protein n=1 Tax=Thalassotalea insulae TaxID=2056778 RepID=A0ABQ6GU34_9GAMM|nr:hypothetical protein tinsulaeT_27950 [Thalassotalea insulae]
MKPTDIFMVLLFSTLSVDSEVQRFSKVTQIQTIK